MRTLMLALVTVLLLVGGFFVYQMVQSTPAVPGTKKAATTAVAASPAAGDGVKIGAVGAGQGVWAMKYDRNTALPMLRFRADDYQPQADGRVKVDQPKADFYIGSDRKRIIHIEGQTGWVTLHGEGPRVTREMRVAGPVQPPTRGDLFDVRISYYLSQAALDAGDPEATLNLHHVSFDVETYRIASEPFTDASGNHVDADDVPIQVRGKEFDFDGYGLQLRWDEFDQRLQMLRVARGKQLVIKHPRDLRFPGAATPGTSPVSSTAVGEAIAAAGRKGAAAAVQAAARKTSDIYRATFHDNVKVVQGDQQLAQALAMNIDFLSPDARTGKQKKAQPSTATAPATKPATSVPPTLAAAATESAGQDIAATPIVVTWGGEFTVNPTPAATIFPRTTDDAVAELVGPGVIITANGDRIECDQAIYHLEPKVAYVRGWQTPARLTDSRGATVISPLIEYSVGERWAMLSGKSSAVIPTDVDGKAETLRASWSKLCTLHFAQGRREGLVEMVELAGDVSIEHPQVRRFKAQKLVLQFDPKAAVPADAKAGSRVTPPLKRLTAEGDVDCLLADTAGSTSAIRCQAMTLDTAIGTDGKLYPTHVEAHGKVVASDGTQEVRAENIAASLLPGATTVGTRKLEIGGLKDLAADGDVSLVSADGGRVQGEKVNVTGGQDGKPQTVRIEGKGNGLAMISRDGRLLSGHLIELNAADQYARISGGGVMRLADSGTSRGTSTPVQLNWTRQAIVDGKSNKASVEGNVVVTYVAADGSTNNAWGERVDAQLGVLDAARRPAKKDSDQMTFLGDRFVQHLELKPASEKEEIQLQSVLAAENGTLIRQLNLMGPILVCDFSPTGLEQLTVPAGKEKPGRMLYIDLPTTARKPVAVQGSLESRGLHGATAFAWKDKLIYSRSKQVVSMLGDVIVRHEPKDRAADSFELTAQRVTAELTEQRDVGGRVPAPSRVNPDAPVAVPVLTRLVAEGAPLWFRRRDLEFSAPLIEFNPVTHVAIAHSSDRLPVHVDKGASRGEFREAQLNTETQMFKLLDAGMTGRK